MDDHCELVHGGIPSKTKGLISMTHFIPADSDKTNWFGADVTRDERSLLLMIVRSVRIVVL